MQALIAVVFAAIVLGASIMDGIKNDPASSTNFTTYLNTKAAGNIILYISTLNKYVVKNYEALHSLSVSTVGTIENTHLLNLPDIQQFDAKNSTLYLNYKSYTFNYSLPNSSADVMPNLFVVTTWDKIIVKGPISNLKLNSIAGEVNQILSGNLFQGNGTFWTTPVLLTQQNCKVEQFFTQIPNKSDGSDALDYYSSYFNNICQQLVQNNISLSKFVFLQPIFLNNGM